MNVLSQSRVSSEIAGGYKPLATFKDKKHIKYFLNMLR